MFHKLLSPPCMFQLKEKTILVIDDSEDNQELLRDIFASIGVRTHCTSNGREALSLLQELFTLPDLILLDAQMPVMDGYEFRSAQKENSRIKDIPVIVMSADPNTNIQEKMLNPEGIVPKPFQLQSLLKNVSDQLNEKNY
jgi:CheY-like chemotaxis protein